MLKLYEDYVNSQTNKTHTLMKNMVRMFKDTFGGSGGGIFSEEEIGDITLVDIEASLEADPLEKNIILEFSDQMRYYQVIFIIKMSDASGKEIEKAYMKVKVYGGDDGVLEREWQGDLTIHVCSDSERNEEGRFFVKVKDEASEMDFIENFIIGKIANMTTDNSSIQ